MTRIPSPRTVWILLLFLTLPACADHPVEHPADGARPRQSAVHPLVTKAWHYSPGWLAYSFNSSQLFFEVPWSDVSQLRPGMRAPDVETLAGPIEFVFGYNAVVFARYPEDGLLYEVAMKFSGNQSVLEDLSYLRAQEFGSCSGAFVPESDTEAAHK